MSRNKQSMHAELETALSELHLSTERWEAILAAAGRMTERENRRRPLRTGLMAAAICAALAVTAVAVSPPLRETLIQFLGSFEPYAQEVEGVSATDQGIELRVVRVLAYKHTWRRRIWWGSGCTKVLPWNPTAIPVLPTTRKPIRYCLPSRWTISLRARCRRGMCIQ